MKGNSAFVGEFSLERDWLAGLGPKDVLRTALPLSPYASALGGVLSQGEVSQIREQIDRQNWIPVGLNGMKGDYTPGDKIGSWRASCFEPALADVIKARLAQVFPDVWTFQDTDTECGEVKTWRWTGVNPLFRFIKYEQGGALVPHYDWAYQAPGSEEKTLVTLVLYLTDTQVSGQTRFIQDPLADVPVAKRNLEDWTRFPREEEVVYAHKAYAGDALLFEHSILHDSADFRGEDSKIIIRTDLVFTPEGV